MFYVYLLISLDDHKHTYVGYTDNLKKRLNLHNCGKGAKFTRGRKWEIIYSKKFKSKSQAMKEEIKLKKNYRLRKEIKQKFISASWAP
jgi:putative endonuclease